MRRVVELLARYAFWFVWTVIGVAYASVMTIVVVYLFRAFGAPALVSAFITIAAFVVLLCDCEWPAWRGLLRWRWHRTPADVGDKS